MMPPVAAGTEALVAAHPAGASACASAEAAELEPAEIVRGGGGMGVGVLGGTPFPGTFPLAPAAKPEGTEASPPPGEMAEALPGSPAAMRAGLGLEGDDRRSSALLVSEEVGGQQDVAHDFGLQTMMRRQRRARGPNP